MEKAKAEEIELGVNESSQPCEDEKTRGDAAEPGFWDVDLGSEEPAAVPEQIEGRQTSQRKREANRRNAQLSTGPKTERGKRSSRLNAFKHGLLARAIPLQNQPWFGPQDQRHLEKVLRDLYSDLRPQGRVEQMLVEQIGCGYFLRGRLYRFQAAVTNLAIEKEIHKSFGGLATTVTEGRSPEQLVKDLDDLLERCKQVLASDQLLPEKLVEDIRSRLVIGQLVCSFAGFYNQVIRKAHYRYTNASFEDFREEINQNRDSFLSALSKGISLTRHALIPERGADKVPKPQYEQHLLPDEGDLRKILRYESMLDREFHHCLDRLDRLRVARMDLAVQSPLMPLRRAMVQLATKLAFWIADRGQLSHRRRENPTACQEIRLPGDDPVAN